MPELKAPVGLGIEGRRLWRSVTADASEMGATLDALEREQLFSACRLRDTIASMEARLAGADLVVPGSRDQLIAHPLLTEIRLHRQLISQTLARLSFPVEDAGSVFSSTFHGRAAANRRWRGPGA
ncbi:hypothetical protein A5791_10355 [Mycobacterium sp. 852002-51163_SCH5372311]|uniref:hypothetical protein n=1 Tax=Mycobacterium sp. 852002-51163_SCH5372311 TaxID=1834097 RepID=UPI000801E7D4|nr:hypothetical protein [Mycobacterium sp. 852002-51163_SCH5372311]OBF79876.1 hypothetical protein A5791_10355 [Mycobacterium sp. 852002-51163_SCH5372311]